MHAKIEISWLFRSANKFRVLEEMLNVLKRIINHAICDEWMISQLNYPGVKKPFISPWYNGGIGVVKCVGLREREKTRDSASWIREQVCEPFSEVLK